MTLKYPTSWSSGGSTAKTYPSVSAYTPLTGKTASSFPSLSSWKPSAGSSSGSGFSFPSLTKGATGNTLYPAPKTSSPASSYPSVSDYFGKLTAGSGSSSPSSSFPSFSLPNRPSGGILGGAGQGSTTSPSWKMPTSGGSSSPAAYSPGGTSASSFFQNLAMPQGFSGAALGGGRAPAQPPAAAPSQAPRPPQATPARTTQPQAPLPSVAQQGLNRYGTPPKGPGVYKTAQEAAYHSGYINNGGVNKDFAFTSQPDAQGNYYVTAKPQPQVAMKPPTVVRQAPPKAAPPPIVGRPTQGHQPVSTPVVAPRPSAWIPPPMTQEEIIEANQGGWLS